MIGVFAALFHSKTLIPRPYLKGPCKSCQNKFPPQILPLLNSRYAVNKEGNDYGYKTCCQCNFDHGGRELSTPETPAMKQKKKEQQHHSRFPLLPSINSTPAYPPSAHYVYPSTGASTKVASITDA